MAKQVTTALRLVALVAFCFVLLSLGFASDALDGGSPGDSSSESSSQFSSSRRSSSPFSSSRRSSGPFSSSRRSSGPFSSSRRSSGPFSASRRSSSQFSSSRRSSSTQDLSVSTTSVRHGTRYYVVAPSVNIYGYSSYKSRHLYVNSGDDDPTVCYSEKETGYNGTALGYFVCPMTDDPDSYSYCCGDDDEQYCCDFWGDSGRAAGAVIGILFGLAVLIGAIVVIWKCCCQNTTKLTVNKHTMTVTGLRSSNSPGYSPLAEQHA